MLSRAVVQVARQGQLNFPFPDHFPFTFAHPRDSRDSRRDMNYHNRTHEFNYSVLIVLAIALRRSFY
ncbi:hypothetical protein PUN28_002887 [Cardiocondyla obscurior]|uniref:Uncharacterized protein n=1 Tax=Cardiocondyla obscurior TaxID=286306 RepID=A0AAW2GWK2_9HYME